MAPKPPNFLRANYFRIPSLVSWATQLICLTLILSSIATCQDGFEYKVGIGSGDVTGACVEVGFMGYANPTQKGAGILTRLFSRAFIIEDVKGNRVVFVSVDAGMTGQLVRAEVMKKLQTKYKGLYNDSNVCISSTHTHSGPAGYLEFVLFEITNLGFYKPTFDAMVSGIVRSIDRAHAKMRPANIFMAQGDLVGSNINRSPYAYGFNPAAERAKYKHNTDTLMTVLKFVGANQEEMGLLNWFAVHPTSMNNTNKLVNGDHKGLASQITEKMFNQGKQRSVPFVAAFANSNLGDVSPNTKGARCQNTGKPCNFVTSSCPPDNTSQQCIAAGPGNNMFQSCTIIANNQVRKAMELYHGATKKLTGLVTGRHQFIDMSKAQVRLNDTHSTSTCPPAMGMSFAAGTTDGPGAFDFTQGDTHGNRFWNTIRHLLKSPSEKQKKCHLPKPILIDTGEMTFPYLWQPKIVDIQMLKVGPLHILGVPGEFTTMAGRRLRDRVEASLKSHGASPDAVSVIAGLSNTYSDYITTFEEYQAQRYEGASTIFGPYTHEAYVQNFEKMALNMAQGKAVEAGPTPPNLLKNQWSFIPPVVWDHAPFRVKFGENIKPPNMMYTPGQEVDVEFQAGDPRNDLMLEGTYLSVEQETNNGWKQIYTDNDWSTRFTWKRTNSLFGWSKVIIQWNIPQDQQPGSYRICHFGHKKILFGKLEAYSGCTKTFTVTMGGTIIGW